MRMLFVTILKVLSTNLMFKPLVCYMFYKVVVMLFSYYQSMYKIIKQKKHVCRCVVIKIMYVREVTEEQMYVESGRVF